MQPKRESDEVLPAGWGAELLARADLVRSFGQLSACRHFYAEAMRARIRSLQLKTAEAARRFESAAASALDAPQTVPNLIRQIALHAFAFENALLRDRAEKSEGAVCQSTPQLSSEQLAEHPELRFAFEIRDAAEALSLLHRGEARKAAKIFFDLVERTRVKRPNSLPTYYLGLAAAQHNMGHKRLALRTIESAGLSLQMGGEVLNQARAAGTLYAFHAALGRIEEAESWRLFMKRLECPKATKTAFLKRGEILLERWTATRQLVVL